jgi:hypothetical protein
MVGTARRANEAAMRNGFLVLLFAIFGVGAIACAVMAWYPQNPVGLFAEPNVHDLGECEQETVKTIQYTIHNNTKKLVELVGIPDTCSCSKAVISQSNLRPGETSQVSVERNLGNARGKRSLPIQLFVKPEPGAPERVMMLYARAIVRGDIEFQPAMLSFTSGQAAERPIQVIYRTEGYRVRDAYGSHPSLAVRWNATEKRAAVTFLPEKWLGLGTAVHVLLETDKPGEPVIRIPVRIEAGP